MVEITHGVLAGNCFNRFPRQERHFLSYHIRDEHLETVGSFERRCTKKIQLTCNSFAK